MPRLLVVSPHFPPANGADAHRVRMTVPFFGDFGWDVEVLAVAAECLTAPQDPWLEQGIPGTIPVHRARGLSTAWRRVPGLGTLDLRAVRALGRTGDRVLGSKPFDLVYFSTTTFGIHVLGPRWKRKYDVPFVMDYQDPWVSDYYREHSEVTPPGGRLKYAVVDRIGRFFEPRVLWECAGVTSVSADYPRQIRTRYPWLHDLPSIVLPFPGSLRDTERMRSEPVQQKMFAPDDGNIHWVYVGRGGGDMETAASGLFAALTIWRSAAPREFARLRIHFIGTSYAASGKGTPTLAPLARKLGLGDHVLEHTDRIPYSTTLKCLADADALILLGSNDAAYTASKLYPYLLARKPLLAIVHQKSSVVDVLKHVGGGCFVTFCNQTTVADLAASISAEWLESNGYQSSVPLIDEAFEDYSDRGAASRLCKFFDEVVRRE